jgi:hypothetical protein
VGDCFARNETIIVKLRQVNIRRGGCARPRFRYGRCHSTFWGESTSDLVGFASPQEIFRAHTEVVDHTASVRSRDWNGLGVERRGENVVLRQMLRRYVAASALRGRENLRPSVRWEREAREHEQRHVRGYYEGCGDDSCAQCPPA